MNALASSVNVLGLYGQSCPCRFTYLCVKEPSIQSNGCAHVTVSAFCPLPSMAALPLPFPGRSALRRRLAVDDGLACSHALASSVTPGKRRRSLRGPHTG